MLLLTHALALSASQFVHEKKSRRAHTSMHSAGLELTKLTCTTLEDNLIRHRGDRSTCSAPRVLRTGGFRVCVRFLFARGVLESDTSNA